MSRFSDLPINNDKLADNYDDFLFYQVYPAMAEINQVNTTTDYRNEQLTKRLLDNLSQDGPWDLASEKRPEFPNRNTYKPFKRLLTTGQFLNGFTAGMATAASGQQPDIVQIPYSDHAYPTRNYEKAGVSPIAALAGFNHYYGNDDWQTWDYPVDLAYNTNSTPYKMPNVLEPYIPQGLIKKEMTKVINNEIKKNSKTEQPIGLNTNNKRVKIDFINDTHLASQLLYNYETGRGQPIELDFSKLNFSEELDIPRLFITSSSEKSVNKFADFIRHLKSSHSQQERNRLLINFNSILKEVFPKKQVEISSLNQDQLVLVFKSPYDGVALNLFKTRDNKKQGYQNYTNPKVIAFGRLAVDIEHLTLTINIKLQKVTVTAFLNPSYRSKVFTYDPDLIDIFDFNIDSKRDKSGNDITTIVHDYGRGTLFKIYRTPHSKSKYSKTYTVEELTKPQF
ncbi:MAG: hypothetical protein K2X01_05280 [Cyanobacteria bacterium]|nr:hypothetical protein [Cyanobacteriota bacterium]